MADSNLTTLQTSFSAGELDPLMRMRTDLKSYFQGARSLGNTALYAQGGFRRRPGSIFRVDLAADSVMHEYSYTVGQDYILAFSANTLKICDASDGSLVQTLTSQPWTTWTICSELTLTYSGDTIMVFHEGFPQRKIVRTSATTFTSAAIDYDEHTSGAPRYQPYFKFLADSVTMTPSATTGSINLTCSTAIFVAGHVGSIFRYKGKEILVDSITSTTIAACTVRETLAGTTADTDWDEQLYSGPRGYPRCGTFHDQRLCFGGSTDRPDGFVASKIGAFFNYDVGTGLDAEAIDASIATDQTSEIRHMVSTRNIQIFTANGELYIPQSTANPFTPGNVSFVLQTAYGSSQVTAPMSFDGATLFVQRTGKVIREYVWNDTEQAYTSGAVSVRSNHLIKNVIDATRLQGTADAPEQYAIFVNSDGTIAVFHSMRNEEIAGWVPWTTPGGTGKYRSVVGSGDKLFACVERTINGSTVYWLEEFNWSITLDAALIFDNTTELSTNGGFATDTDWTKGTGWTIASSAASCDGTQTGNSDLEQAITTSSGTTYRVTFTVSNYSAGTITPIVADGSGTAINADGTYIKDIVASTGSNLQFRADSDFVGTLDTVSVAKVATAFTAAHLLNTSVKATANSSAQYLGEKTADGSGVATFDDAVSHAVVGLDYTINVDSMPVDAVARSGSSAVTGSKKRISRVVISLYATQAVSLSNNTLILTQSDTDFSAPPSAAEGEYEFFMLGYGIDQTVPITQAVPLPVSVRGIYTEVTA